jgi:hypothetical protein
MRLPVIAALLCIAITPANADKRFTGLGLGLELGHPTGLTVKGSVADRLAIQGGLGSGVFRGYGLYVYGDLLFTLKDLSPTMFLYLGPGVRVWDHHYDALSRYDRGRDSHLGLRVPFGISVQTPGHPIEIFVEAGIVLDVTSGKGCNRLAPSTAMYCRSDGPIDLLASFGFRYYFGRKR